MVLSRLIVDSGSTKASWSLITDSKTNRFETPGMSPYFLTGEEMEVLLNNLVKPAMGETPPDEIFFYGTGCASPDRAFQVKAALNKVFPRSVVEVHTDLLGAARGLAGKEPAVISILGTGSSSAYYDGNELTKEITGLGYILGDEGSGAYLGRKVLQYYLYGTFDEDLISAFRQKYDISREAILDNVYRKPLPNRFIASFALFLTENRGHFMIENIIEDGLNDFFFHHLCKYQEVWSVPVHFTGGVAAGFGDVVEQLCRNYEFETGVIRKEPMEGLIRFHQL